MSTNKSPPTHQDYCDAVIASLESINPHRAEQGRKGYVYAAGFLASYLASLMSEDPWAYKRFRQHIESLEDDRTHTPD